MGCICSFFKTLTSYHGSHLTAHQVSRQKQQRSKMQRPRNSPPATPEKEPTATLPPGFTVPPKSPKGSLRGAVKSGATEEDRLLNFSPVQKHKLSDCKQSSFSRASFSKS